MTFKYKSGFVFGDWTLSKPLGDGGNCEVWEVTATHSDYLAMKILRKTSSTHPSYQRFRDEISLLLQLHDDPGVIGLLDSNCPDNPTKQNPAYYLMPVATPVLKHIESTALNSHSVIQGVSQLAHTLARLASTGASHRDLKPSNILVLNDRWLLADFGLASFPGKSELTTSARHLGPLHFIAPEMLNSPDTADGRKADVYSLGKTLWVLLTGQNYPLPGQHDPNAATMRLDSYLSSRRTQTLDVLLHHMTTIDPSPRISMEHVANDLDSWIAGPPITRDIPDLSSIGNKILAVTSPIISAQQQSRQHQLDRERYINTLLSSIDEELKQIAIAMHDATGLTAGRSNDYYQHDYLDEFYSTNLLNSESIVAHGSRTIIMRHDISGESNGIILVTLLNTTIDRTDSLNIYAGHFLSIIRHHSHTDIRHTWKTDRSARAFSPIAKYELASMLNDLKEQLKNALIEFYKMIKTHD